MTAARTAHRHRVLVIEDDPTIRRLLTHELKARGCDVVEGAVRGEPVAPRASHEPPCVVFVDVVVPEIESANIVERLREFGIGEDDRRVVAVTAAGTSEGVRLLGAVDCLEKPFALARVVELVARHCSRAARRRP